MNPQPTDAGPPIQWDPVECSTYIVTVVGNQERFPECNPYHPGAMMLQTRLHHRYGEDYAKSCSKLLRAFLEDLETGTPEERSIWHQWRLAHQAKVVSRWPGIVQNRNRVTAWCDGGLEKDWDDPNKPGLRIKIKGVLANLKLRCWDVVCRSTPPRQQSPDPVGFCSELSVTGLPC
ncbi:hypothetical protein XANCAGTX0491_005034 [Xanthoria calcicola]